MFILCIFPFTYRTRTAGKIYRSNFKNFTFYFSCIPPDRYPLEEVITLNQKNEIFHKYYLENRALVFYTVFGIVKCRETAEDLTNDVFVSLFEYLKKDKPPIAKVRPWLAVAAKRRAYNYMRDNQRLVAMDSGDSGVSKDGSGFSADFENRLFTSELLECLYQHNPRWFDIVEKYYFLEMTTREIALEYHCSEPAIRNVLHRAKVFLRKKFKE